MKRRKKYSIAIIIDGSMTDITPTENDLVFQEIPEYATTALWIEWYRARRREPPADMICTTGESYQNFCRQCNVNPENFPSIFVTRETLVDISEIGASGFREADRKQLIQALEQWDESDQNVYVAFIYEGVRRQSIVQAVVKQLEGA